MVAFLDAVENGLGHARAKNRDAMSLDFRDPFIFCIFPRALRGDGKNGEIRAVVPRLTLLRVGSNESDDRYRVGPGNVSFFCPIFLGHPKARAAASKASGCFMGGNLMVV